MNMAFVRQIVGVQRAQQGGFSAAGVAVQHHAFAALTSARHFAAPAGARRFAGGAQRFYWTFSTRIMLASRVGLPGGGFAYPAYGAL
jgi:hypothetical protein